MPDTSRALVVPDFVLVETRITYISARKQLMLPGPSPTTPATREPRAPRALGALLARWAFPLASARRWCYNFPYMRVCVFSVSVLRIAIALTRLPKRESSDFSEYTLSAPGSSAKTEPWCVRLRCTYTRVAREQHNRPPVWQARHWSPASCQKTGAGFQRPSFTACAPWRLRLRLRHGEDSCPELFWPLAQSISAAPYQGPTARRLPAPSPAIRPPGLPLATGLGVGQARMEPPMLGDGATCSSISPILSACWSDVDSFEVSTWSQSSIDYSQATIMPMRTASVCS